MKFNEIVKKIKKQTWWSEEAPGNYQILFTAWRSFVLQNKVYRRKFLSICLALYKDDFCWEKTSEQEKLRQFYRIFRLYQSNPKIIEKYYQTYHAIRTKLIKTGELTVRKLKKFTDRQLIRAYEKLYDLAALHFAHSLIPESADIYTDQKLITDFAKATREKYKFEDLVKMAVILSAYPMRFFMEQEKLDFLKLALVKKPDFKTFAENHHWSQNNYLAAKNLSANYFKKAMSDLLKNKTREEINEEIELLENKSQKLRQRQKKLLAELQLPKSVQKTFEFLRLASRWIDERKFGALHMVYYIDSLVAEFAQRIKLSKYWFGYYTPQELVELFKTGEKISAHILQERKKLSVYVTFPAREGFKEQIFTGKKARQIFKLFEARKQKIIKGVTVSAPAAKLQGRVQIILNPHKERFTAGRILVTTMTRPDFVPFMHKALAIITNEGGMTSHAAILSRELGIPCIIGTKIATKVLKDGDEVIMDLKTGEIKKHE